MRTRKTVPEMWYMCTKWYVCYARCTQENRSEVRMFTVTSRSFAIKSGVCQGSNLAPFQLNLVIDHIMISALQTVKFGVSLDDTAMTDLNYVDDVALIDDNIDDIQRLLDALNIEAESCGLKINVKKTEFCSRRRHPLMQRRPTQSGQTFQISGELDPTKRRSSPRSEVPHRPSRVRRTSICSGAWTTFCASWRLKSTTLVSPVGFSTPAKTGRSAPESWKVWWDSTWGASEEL